jgi:hypothetical protein
MATKAVAKFNDGAKYVALSGDNGALQEALTENVGDDQLSEFDIDRVRMPTGGGTTWEVPTLEGVQSTQVIEGIIIAWFNRRAYWAGEYSGGNEPPQCSSLDGITGVGEPGGDCAACPFAQFGSSVNPQSPNAQACKQVRQLFVLTPDAMLPTVITLPATSLKPIRSYMFRLTSASIPHTGIITKFSLEKDKSGTGFDYAKVVLAAGERLSPEARAKVQDYAKALMPAFQRVQVIATDVAGTDVIDSDLEGDDF